MVSVSLACWVALLILTSVAYFGRIVPAIDPDQHPSMIKAAFAVSYLLPVLGAAVPVLLLARAIGEGRAVVLPSLVASLLIVLILSLPALLLLSESNSCRTGMTFPLAQSCDPERS
jgi:hypothetical protein